MGIHKTKSVAGCCGFGWLERIVATAVGKRMHQEDANERLAPFFLVCMEFQERDGWEVASGSIGFLVFS